MSRLLECIVLGSVRSAIAGPSGERIMRCRMGLTVLIAALAITSAPAGTLLEDIKASVKSRWQSVSERCSKVSSLKADSNRLSGSILKAPIKKIKDKQIAYEIDKIREALLSKSANEILAKVDEIDAKLEADRDRIGKLLEEKEFYPERKDKIEKEIVELKNEMEVLSGKRVAELEHVKKELSQIGLKVEGKAGDNLFALVTKDDIIDNVVVARNVIEIVTKLQSAMAGGDMTSAKRYFGVYVIMTEINIKCLEDYIDKSRNGEWRKKLNALEEATRDRVKVTVKNSGDERFSEKQRNAFRRNLEMSNTLLSAIELYKKLLDSQEKVVEKRLVEIRKVYELAQDSYATISAASEFLALMQSNQDDFATILDLEVPELEIVPDVAIQEQMQSITRMLDR